MCGNRSLCEPKAIGIFVALEYVSMPGNVRLAHARQIKLDGVREMAKMSGNGVCLVVGAGGAIARRFAREGFVTCVTRRKADALTPLVAQIAAAGGTAHAFGSDARKEEDVLALVQEIENTIGANVPCGILEETARKYKIWEMSCFAGFLNGREVAKRMVAWQHHFYRRHGIAARRG